MKQIARVRPEHVHKPSKSDVVIKDIECLAEGRYRAKIINKSWRHFLGWPPLGHLEGMLMIEALQQVVKAARKLYLNDWRYGYYFTGLNTRFIKLASDSEDHFVEVQFNKERNMIGDSSKAYVNVKGKIVDSDGQVKAEGSGHCVIYPVSFNLGPEHAREKMMLEYLSVLPYQVMIGAILMLYAYLMDPQSREMFDLFLRCLYP